MVEHICLFFVLLGGLFLEKTLWGEITFFLFVDGRTDGRADGESSGRTHGRSVGRTAEPSEGRAVGGSALLGGESFQYM